MHKLLVLAPYGPDNRSPSFHLKESRLFLSQHILKWKMWKSNLRRARTHTRLYTHTLILLFSPGRNMTSFSWKSNCTLFLFSGDDCASNACNGDFWGVNTTCTTYKSPVYSECVAPQTVTEKKRKQSFFFFSCLPAPMIAKIIVASVFCLRAQFCW